MTCWADFTGGASGRHDPARTSDDEDSTFISVFLTPKSGAKTGRVVLICEVTPVQDTVFECPAERLNKHPSPGGGMADALA